MEAIQVFNRGQLVGSLCDAMPDMEYLEGAFLPAETLAAERFVAASASLNAQTVMEQPTAGIRAVLRESPADSGTTFVVMSFSDGRLFGRRVFDRRAVDWVERNVPE